MFTPYTNDICLEDSDLKLSETTQGYYRIGEKYFNKKMNALREASITKLPVSWDFHRKTFENYIDTHQNDLPLEVLYKQRAMQIREKYDYIILAFSGGSDSDCVLKTFTKNKIHLDEVWTDLPFTLVEKAGYQLNRSLDASNIISEWPLVIKPELDILSVTNPEIKINITDNFINPEIEYFEDTVSIMSYPSAYVSIKRFRRAEKILRERAKTYKNPVLILGQDKPIIYSENKTYGMVFSDFNTYFKSDRTDKKEVNVEYFFWASEFPQLPVAMARSVWNYLLEYKSLALQKLRHQTPSSLTPYFRKTGFDRIIKEICYADWDFNKHQVNKTRFAINNQQWLPYINKFKHEKFYQSWLSAIQDYSKILDPNIAFADKKSIIDSDVPVKHMYLKLGELPW